MSPSGLSGLINSGKAYNAHITMNICCYFDEVGQKHFDSVFSNVVLLSFQFRVWTSSWWAFRIWTTDDNQSEEEMKWVCTLIV